MVEAIHQRDKGLLDRKRRRMPTMMASMIPLTHLPNFLALPMKRSQVARPPSSSNTTLLLASFSSLSV